LAALVVVDSGIVLATILQEPFSDKARALLESWQKQNLQLAAPELFRYEVVAVVRKCLHQGQLTPEEALKGRDIVLALPIQFYLDDALLKRAYDLATQYDRPTAYDSQYLAVAERLECEFWTADDRLFSVVKQQIAWVKRLGDFKTL
jgi:predicted nucleic acid-binding protein